MNEQKLSPIDILLDEQNDENIILYDENNKENEFEQIAVIPMDDKTYVLLRPVEKWDGLGDDEAVVFSIDEIDDEDCLVLVESDKIIDEVFERYYDLLRAQGVQID